MSQPRGAGCIFHPMCIKMQWGHHKVGPASSLLSPALYAQDCPRLASSGMNSTCLSDAPTGNMGEALDGACWGTGRLGHKALLSLISGVWRQLEDEMQASARGVEQVGSVPGSCLDS